MNAVQIYVTDVGKIILPDDFPSHALRKDGRPDRRQKVAEELQEYIDDLKAGALALWTLGEPVDGTRAMSWGAGLKS